MLGFLTDGKNIKNEHKFGNLSWGLDKLFFMSIMGVVNVNSPPIAEQLGGQAGIAGYLRHKPK